MSMSIAGLAQRNKREAQQSLEATKRQLFDNRVAHLVETGKLDSGVPVADRIHAVLLSNRPGAAAELPAPAKWPEEAMLVQTGPANFIVTDPPLYDLLIATKKHGYGSRTRDAQDAPIVWLKQAGKEKRAPKCKNTTMAQVVKFLEGYELVATEVRQFEIIKKYRKVSP